MTDQRDDGGAAFPMPFSTDEHTIPCNCTTATFGMSLRDFFAAHALSGILACGSPYVEKDGECLSQADGAFAYADAMLEARKR